MKIKHYMGYGLVNAKLIEMDQTTIVINVWGNHECGLDRSEDSYDINQWLVKKVAKLNITQRQIKYVECNPIEDINGEEAVQYIISYEK